MQKNLNPKNKDSIMSDINQLVVEALSPTTQPKSSNGGKIAAGVAGTAAVGAASLVPGAIRDHYHNQATTHMGNAAEDPSNVLAHAQKAREAMNQAKKFNNYDIWHRGENAKIYGAGDHIANATNAIGNKFKTDAREALSNLASKLHPDHH